MSNSGGNNFNMAMRASESANEYAQKKKEQLEAAKRLREERKQASLLKNVGEQFVLKPSNSGNKGGNPTGPGGMLLTTSSSGFSQKSNNSGGNNGQQPQHRMQQPNGSGYQQQNNQYSHNGMGTSQSMGLGYQNAQEQYNNGGGYPQNQYQMNQGYHMTPGNGTRTQENYYNPQMYQQNQRGAGGSHSIQYEDMTTPSGQNYHQGATTFSGGFQRNSQNFGASPQQYSQPPSATQQQFRSTRNTSTNNITTSGALVTSSVSGYSRQELEVARSNLKLLKNRMSSQKKPYNGGIMMEDGGSGGGYRGYDQIDKRPFNYDENQSGYNQANSKGANGPSMAGGRPPSGRRAPPNDNTNQYQNMNFRKAFVPSFQSDAQNLDQINDVVLGGNPKNGYSQSKQQMNNNYESGNSGFKQNNQRGGNPGQFGGNNNRFDPDSHAVGNSSIPSYGGNKKGNYYQDEELNIDDNGGYSYSKPKQQAKNSITTKKQSNIKHRDYDEQEEEPVSKEQEQKKLLSLYENAGDDQDAFENGGGDEDRIECNTCGRKFAEEALMKHSKICKKVFVQKRKVFDVKKVREEAIQQEMKDSDYQPSYNQKKAPPKKAAAEKPIAAGSKAAKWKAQSEMFRAAMRANRTTDDDPKGQAAQAMIQATMEQHDDRVECKWCNRKFNDHAAERHIPVCEKKYKELQMKSKGNTKGNVANKTGIGFKK